ncbi:hypothetical protein KY284_007658 [Solanum tuberosum]|nr:hypothetical protein KY284_007658 [Solanum tuberosum]
MSFTKKVGELMTVKGLERKDINENINSFAILNKNVLVEEEVVEVEVQNQKQIDETVVTRVESTHGLDYKTDEKLEMENKEDGEIIEDCGKNDGVVSVYNKDIMLLNGGVSSAMQRGDEEDERTSQNHLSNRLNLLNADYQIPLQILDPNEAWYPVQLQSSLIHGGIEEVHNMKELAVSSDVEDKEENENLQVENLVFNEAGVSPETVITHKGKNKWEVLPTRSNPKRGARNGNSPWLIGGDFNVIISDEEKIGGMPVYPNEYEDFAFCVNSCDLVEVSFKGSPFIRWNGRIDDQCIFKRLDRYMMNQVGLGYFGLVESEHLARTGSDHAPMLLTCGQKTDVVKRPFRFLKFWSEHVEFQQVVKDSWISEEADVFIRLKQKIKKTKTALSNWSRATFGDIFKQLSIREEIVRVKEALFETSPTTGNIEILQKAQVELKSMCILKKNIGDRRQVFSGLQKGRRTQGFFTV